MYPESFEYYSPESVEDALSLLEEHAGEDCRVLSGGHSLVPTMKSGLAAPDVIVDIGDIEEMSGVRTESGRVHVGACTRYEEVLTDDVRHHTPMLAEATREIGDKQVRSRGTVGGNVAHADPASDLPAVMIATDATIHARSPSGDRTIAADEFFLGVYTTAVASDEIVTRIEIPALERGASAYVKKESPSSGYAVVGVGVRLRSRDGHVSDAGVAANGAVDHAVRLDAVEESLEGRDPSDVALDEVAGRATDGLDGPLLDDLEADPEYRAQLLESYTKRAIETAVERLPESS